MPSHLLVRELVRANGLSAAQVGLQGLVGDLEGPVARYLTFQTCAEKLLVRKTAILDLIKGKICRTYSERADRPVRCQPASPYMQLQTSKTF